MNLNLIQSLYLGTLPLLVESYLKDHVQAHYSMFCHIVVNGGFFVWTPFENLGGYVQKSLLGFKLGYKIIFGWYYDKLFP